MSRSPGRPERKTDAVGALTDACKQLLTLTATITAVTIAFAHDIAENASAADQRWLRAAWISYAVSIIAGCFALVTVANRLGIDEHMEEKSGDYLHYRQPIVFDLPIRIPVQIQLLSFCIGVVLTIMFGIFALG